MKIAISTSGAGLDAPYNPRFGRAAQFCIIDDESDGLEIIQNPAINAAGGAGVQAAQLIAQTGVDVVISGAFGPNAFDTLEAAGIQMYLAPAGGNQTVSDLLNAYRNNQLDRAQAASHGGYHSGRRRGGF
jgi:predicted Fe-Mo cluster-binding NifX family protein